MNIKEFTEKMLATMERAIEILDQMELKPLDLQPTIRYKLAGSPYGRHTRGKKRWLLEEKREARAERLG